MTEWLWIPGLLTHAFQCPSVFVPALVFVVAFLVLALPSRLRLPGPLLLAVIVMAAWIFRDRSHLLGDGWLWISTAARYGGNLPGFSEPVAAVIVGLASSVMQPIASSEVVLAGLSIASGVGFALALGAFMRRGSFPDGWLPMALALVFCQPMSFVFYGHTETYPVVAAILSLSLLAILADLESERPRWPALLALAALPLVHFMLVLLVPAYVASRFAGPAAWKKALLVYLAAAAAGGILSLESAPVRAFTLLSGQFPLPQYPVYFGSFLNGAAIAAAPAIAAIAGAGAAGAGGGGGRSDRSAGGGSSGRSARGRFAGLWDDRKSRFLLLSSASLLGLFLFVTMDLGPFADTDLLTPAFVTLTFLLGAHLDRIGSRHVRICLLAGAPFLAAWIAITRCEAGEELFRDQAESRALKSAGQIYVTQVLALHQKTDGRPAEAIATLIEGFERHPGSRSLLSSIAQIQLEQGDTAVAIATLERAVDSPDGRWLAGRLAELYIRTGRAESAVRLLETDRPAALRSRDAAAALAVAYFRMGRHDSTVAVSRARIVRDDRDAVAWNNLAAGLFGLGRPLEGLDALYTAARLDPHNRAIQSRIVAVLLQFGGREDALAYLERIPRSLADSLRAEIARDRR